MPLERRHENAGICPTNRLVTVPAWRRTRVCFDRAPLAPSGRPRSGRRVSPSAPEGRPTQHRDDDALREFQPRPAGGHRPGRRVLEAQHNARLMRGDGRWSDDASAASSASFAGAASTADRRSAPATRAGRGRRADSPARARREGRELRRVQQASLSPAVFDASRYAARRKAEIDPPFRAGHRVTPGVARPPQRARRARVNAATAPLATRRRSLAWRTDPGARPRRRRTSTVRPPRPRDGARASALSARTAHAARPRGPPAPADQVSVGRRRRGRRRRGTGCASRAPAWRSADVGVRPQANDGFA